MPKHLADKLPNPKPWRMGRHLLRAWLKVCYRLEVRGLEHIPATGGVLIAPSHASYFDPFVVNLAQWRPLCFMAWDGLFKFTPVAWAIGKLGAFPVSHGRIDRQSWRIARTLLERGEGLVVFPEGNRSPDNVLQPLRPGVARLALDADVPIVPVRLAGLYEAWPRSNALPRPWGRFTIEFRPAIQVRPAGEGREAREAAEAELLTRLEAELAAGIGAESLASVTHGDSEPQRAVPSG